MTDWKGRITSSALTLNGVSKTTRARVFKDFDVEAVWKDKLLTADLTLATVLSGHFRLDDTGDRPYLDGRLNLLLTGQDGYRVRWTCPRPRWGKIVSKDSSLY